VLVLQARRTELEVGTEPGALGQPIFVTFNFLP
jgi:hypothetical protein